MAGGRRGGATSACRAPCRRSRRRRKFGNSARGRPSESRCRS